MITKSLLKTIYQNRSDALSEVEALLDAGEDPNYTTEYSESPLRVASNNGRFDIIKLLLDRGADKTQLGWTNIFYAIAYGDHKDIEDEITRTKCLEDRDFWERTPLLFSILVGDTNKILQLLNAGADVNAVGRCGKVPLAYAIQKDDVAMLEFLTEQGFDIEQRDDHDCTPLIESAERGAIKCLKSLIAKGADIFAKNHIPQSAIEYASDLKIVAALIEAGANINEISRERRAEMLGYGLGKAPDISPELYFKGRNREFGKSNPERANNPFWQAMVKCGGSGYHASKKFNDDSFKNGPIWSFDRFGKSITILKNGRYLEVAGEHEDHYDPDFCIYNDVFIHDGHGNCEIYIYPKEIFPPTDFHTATLVDDDVYIIGSLGYPEDRRPGYTQVFKLDTGTLKMERVETSGEMPGWINSHTAFYDGVSSITIKGGNLVLEEQGERQYIDNLNEYSLDLNSMKWRKT